MQPATATLSSHAVGAPLMLRRPAAGAAPLLPLVGRHQATAPLRAAAAPQARRRSSARCQAAPAAAPATATAEPKFEPQVCVVLGTQWGDEGKGKLVDILAQEYEIVARAQVGFDRPLPLPCARNPHQLWSPRRIGTLPLLQLASGVV